jgi:SNF2 family DNA or RNA helicase
MIFNPWPYQMYCIYRCINETALGLFLDMGLGKTVITLTAVNDLHLNRWLVNKILVIAPKKVAEATWSREAAKWEHLKHLRISTVLGSEQRRIKALCTPADIYVINRENVCWLVDHYRNAWPFDMVIVDEFSSFKNHEAKRVKALASVRPHIKRIIGLTGTPAPNGLMDLWAQIYLLDGGQRLYDKIGKFRARYFNAHEMGAGQIRGYDIREGAEQEIHQRISDICVSMKAEDYLQLPDCITIDVPVVLEGKARQAYDKLEREALLEVDEKTIDAGTAAVLTNKLLQLCNGAVYASDVVGLAQGLPPARKADREVVEIHNEKIEAFLELVEGLQGKPVLVFYNFQHDLARIQKALQPMGLRVKVLATPADEEAWNRREIDILLAHPASAAYGLNLQDGGNHMIWFGLNWSLELYQQAVKRLHRQGQKQKVFVHRLCVVGGVDEDVAAALEEKGATQNRLMEAIKARIEHAKEGDPRGHHERA